ncbi:MAG: hypothetical protein ACYS1A_12895 [Planctomycetota bacterium]|jgi:hypothetical protein
MRRFGCGEMLKWVGKKGEILEGIYWIEKVVAVEKQVRFFFNGS